MNCQTERRLTSRDEISQTLLLVVSLNRSIASPLRLHYFIINHININGLHVIPFQNWLLLTQSPMHAYYVLWNGRQHAKLFAVCFPLFFLNKFASYRLCILVESFNEFVHLERNHILTVRRCVARILFFLFFFFHSLLLAECVETFFFPRHCLVSVRHLTLFIFICYCHRDHLTVEM